MATVTSFESLSHPAKSELRQFAELFTPLFQSSSDDARRQAVAALSQCPQVPPAVSLFIGCQPISVAAVYLTCSQALDDETLIHIAQTQGAEHARAIARRENLSPQVLDVLVGMRRTAPPARTLTPAAEPMAELPAPPPSPDAATRSREDALRDDLRKLARHFFPPEDDRLGRQGLSAVQDALLVRFARLREGGPFATALADALSASRWLGERIMLDISGQQLATTLISLGMDTSGIAFILTRFYPHLAERSGSGTRAQALISGLDRTACDQRVESWLKADRYTYDPQSVESGDIEAAAARNRVGEPQSRAALPSPVPRTASGSFGRRR